MYFFSGYIYLPCAPTSFATHLPWENCLAGMNTDYFDAGKSPFIWVLTSQKVIIDVSQDLFILLLVSTEQKVDESSVSCPKLQIYHK